VAPAFEPWRRYLVHVLAEPVGGLNLRNEVGHGLTDELYGSKEAAILIHAACLLQRLG
jgi:hypothetical protein